MTRAAETPRVLFVNAASRPQLLQEVQRLERLLSLDAADAPPPQDLLTKDRLTPGEHCVTLVASTNGEALTRLRTAAAGLSDANARRIHNPAGVYYFDEPLGHAGRVAFLFPGEGAEHTGMLANVHPVVLSSRWMHLVERRLGRPLSAGALSPTSASWVAFAVGLAFSELLGRLGVTPDMAAGHSFGEWSALLAMGYLEVDTDDEILESMAALDRNLEDAMAQQRTLRVASTWVVHAGKGLVERVLERLAGRVFLAADNSAHQVTLGGSEEAVDEAVTELTRAGAICDRRPEPMAPHTPMFEGMAEQLSKRADIVGIRPPRVVVYSCATAAPFPADAEGVRRLMARQWIEPVRFRELIESMYRDGARIFIDVGPRGHLAGFVDDTLRGRPHAAISMSVADNPHEQLSHAIALLGAHQVPLDLQALNVTARPRPSVPVAGSARPFIRAAPSRADDTLTASCTLDLSEDRFLCDHVFGGVVSIRDPRLLALPIVPFAVNLEMLVETATALAPDRMVTGLRDVRVHRFLALDDDGRLALVLSAKRSGPDQVKAEIRRVSEPEGQPLVEGIVAFGASRLASVPGDRLPRPARARARATSGDYEGPHKRTFHGPQFRSVHELLWAHQGGAETVLRPPSTGTFFRSVDGRGLVLDPVAIDGVGQSAAYWLESHFGKWVSVLPCMLGELTLHGTPLAAGTEMTCIVSERGVTEPLSKCDASLVAPDGSLVATVRDWTDWLTFQPPRYRAFSLSPLDTFLSIPASGAAPWTRQLEAFPPRFIESMGGLWIQVLRCLVLSREERKGWLGWGDTDLERLSRLMERIVAKDVVRSLLRARTGESWGAADIDLGAQPSTPERVSGSWGTLGISVSCAEGTWSATASEDPDAFAA